MFRKRAATPQRPADLVAALGNMQRLAASRPELASPAETLAAALDATFRVPEPPPPLARDADQLCAGENDLKRATPDKTILDTDLRRSLTEGIPIAQAFELIVDPDRLSTRAQGVCKAMCRHNPSADQLLQTLHRDPSQPLWWGRAILAGRADEAERDWANSGLDPALMAVVVRLAWLPALATWSHALAATIAQHGRVGGDCPLCGANPLLAEARGLEARRYLRCGRCAAEWPAPRLGCPACGEDDPRQWRILTFEGEADRYRLGCCLTCGHRVKVVATLARLSPPALLVAELATIHLDAIPNPQGAATQGTG